MSEETTIVDVAAVDIAKINPDELRTRAEIAAEDFVAGTIICRGPRILTPAQFDAGMAKRARLRAAVDFDGLVAMAQDLILHHDGTAVVDPAVGELADHVTLADLLERTLKLLDRRRPCGEDLGVLRAASAEPYDGKRHTQVCPKCGETRYWWPAVSVEDFPALQAERAEALTRALT